MKNVSPSDMDRDQAIADRARKRVFGRFKDGTATQHDWVVFADLLENTAKLLRKHKDDPRLHRDEEFASIFWTAYYRMQMFDALLAFAEHADPVTGELPKPTGPKVSEYEREKGAYRQQKGTLVYTAFAIDGTVLYVGVTDNLFSRMSQHQQQSRWWDTMERLVWEEWPDRDTALRQESRLIRRYKPPFNTVHNPDRRRPM